MSWDKYSLNICSDNHEEICFVGTSCPACQKISSLEQEITSLNDDITTLKNQLDDAIQERDTLQAQINEDIYDIKNYVKAINDE